MEMSDIVRLPKIIDGLEASLRACSRKASGLGIAGG